MRLSDYGDFVDYYAAGVATTTLTMLPDRAGDIRYISITDPSAADTWIVQIQTKEVMRIPVDTVGNQHFFSQSMSKFPNESNFFAWYEFAFGHPITIPIPVGQACIISSVGGATANIEILYDEYSSNSDIASKVNYALGKHFILPIFGNVAAGQTAVGEISLASAARPAWVPDVYSGIAVPLGWQVNILALFQEAFSVNTFSGAANHVSSSSYYAYIKNAKRLFTHPTQNTGVYEASEAAAAGSANSVYTPINSKYAPFDYNDARFRSKLEYQLPVGPGDVFSVRVGTTGDATGTASYAHAYHAMLAEVIQLV